MGRVPCFKSMQKFIFLYGGIPTKSKGNSSLNFDHNNRGRLKLNISNMRQIRQTTCPTVSYSNSLGLYYPSHSNFALPKISRVRN